MKALYSFSTIDNYCLVGIATDAASAPGWTDQASVNYTGRTADGLYPMLLSKGEEFGDA
jgi:hypothetical protein